MSKLKNDINKVIVYQSKSGKIEFRGDVQKDTIWGSLNQIAELFDRDKSVISRHIKNIYKSLELQEKSTVAKIATVQKDTIWGSLNQIAELFDRDKSVISRHIKNICKSLELQEKADSSILEHTGTEIDEKSNVQKMHFWFDFIVA